jgi:hypothetical protein
MRLPYFNYLNEDNINNNFMESEDVTDEPAYGEVEL